MECRHCGRHHSETALCHTSDAPIIDNPPWPTGESLGGPPDHSRQNRIEALRAASRIVAGMYAGRTWPQDVKTGKEVEMVKSVLTSAERFVRYIEKGERDGTS